MTIPQKMLFSFLLSALFCAGIAALALTGIIGKGTGIVSVPARIVILAVVFLASFLIIFLCFNLRRDSAGKMKNHHEHEKLEELETVEETSVDFMSTDFMFAEAVQVESVTGLGGSVFMFRQPFTFMQGNPELLQETGNANVMSEVVYEQNGIHYINSSFFVDDKDRAEFDRNFANLVESVVNKKELML